jgi:hypothetical protein
MSGVLPCVDAIRESLFLVREAFRDFDVGEPLLRNVWIAIVVVTVFREGFLLILPTHVGHERGIIKGLLGMCIAKLCGCRSGRGLRAQGTRQRADVRLLCVGRSVSAVGYL